MMCLLRPSGLAKGNLHRLKRVDKSSIRHYKRHYKDDGMVTVRVIGSGSYGDPASLYVRTSDHSRALFNCGEGTFRLMYSRGLKPRFITDIFCTRNDWECVGGIPSIGRAVYDHGRQFPQFHGPPKLATCLEKFAFVTDLNPKAAVREHQFNVENFHDDAKSQIDFIDLHRENGGSENEPSVIAYVCRLKPSDNIDINKLSHIELPKHAKRQLINGQDVTLNNGITITHDQLKTNVFSGANFLVIDVPSKEYLKDLERNEQLNLHLENIQSGNGMAFVAHFAKPEIIETPEYQRFMRRLESKKHFALNESNSFSGLKYVHKLQNELSSVDDAIFPLLCSKYDLNPATFTCYDQIDSISREPAVIEPVSMFTTYFFPPINHRVIRGSSEGIQETDENVESDEEELDDDSDDDENFSSNLTTPMGDQRKQTGREKIFPRIVFFGTGSSFPGVTKSATAILVHTSPVSSVLLDCGEGTVGQFCRFYGTDTPEVIKTIKGLFISHMHGDHHMGIMDLIRFRQRYMPTNRPPLVIMAPKEEYGELLDFYEEKFGNVSGEYELIDNEDLINSELTDDHKKLMDVVGIRTCWTPHTESSFAISLKLNTIPKDENEFKLTFSGDSIPNVELIELGKDSNLLIHEATLDDSRAISAADKKHSTVSQAIQQGRAMDAKFILLTHFSQRYRKLIPIEESLVDSTIGVAFDNMEVVPSDLPNLNNLYLKLKERFRDEEKCKKKISKQAKIKLKNL